MTSFKMDAGYPKLMSEGFRGIPFNVDAVFRWTGNGKIYFFKGDQYWKFDPSRGSEPVSSSYPQPVSNWGNLPGNLDAAVTYSNGRSYFFKKGYYYRFDDARFQVGAHLEGIRDITSAFSHALSIMAAAGYFDQTEGVST